MRSHLIDIMTVMCSNSELHYYSLDAFCQNTDFETPEAYLLVELMLITGTDYITIMRKAMGL